MSYTLNLYGTIRCGYNKANITVVCWIWFPLKMLQVTLPLCCQTFLSFLPVCCLNQLKMPLNISCVCKTHWRTVQQYSKNEEDFSAEYMFFRKSGETAPEQGNDLRNVPSVHRSRSQLFWPHSFKNGAPKKIIHKKKIPAATWSH